MEGERVTQEILRTKGEFVALYREGRAFALSLFYAEDARILAPNSDLIRGKEGIRNFWQSLMDMEIVDLQMGVSEMDIVGNTVIDMCEFNLIGSKQSILDKGNHLVIWKQLAGVWKINKEVFNSNQPAQ